MYKRILVTLDGSKLSDGILPAVQELAAGTDAQVTLLTVAPLPEAIVVWAMGTEDPLVTVGSLAQAAVEAISPRPRRGETRGQAIERVRQELRAMLEERAQPLRERGIAVETVIRFGDPAETILQYARKKDMDLIAMATHGRGGLARLVFGSVASRIVESGERPVLLVRPHELAEKESR